MSANICRGTDLSHLEGNVAAVADDFRADLDQFLAQTGQRPRLRRLGYCQRAHEISQVVGKRVELKAHGIGCEGAAGQPRPLDRVLAFLDVLLARAALIVEGNDALGRARQIANDKADARVQLARMPLNLGHHVARLIPALRLIPEADKVAADLVRWSPNGAL